MKIHIKNQLKGKIEFCCGEKEYGLDPGQQITIEANDEDCMHLDTFTPQEMDWAEAEQHLKTYESAYSEIGSAGYLALTRVIRPLRDRFNKGERTQELYNEIMSIQ